MRLRDHIDCGGGGCDSCNWDGVEMAEPSRPDTPLEMPHGADAFEAKREECPCYEGITVNDGANQCMHPDADGEWCGPGECPLVAPNVKVTGLPQCADGSTTNAADCGRSG